MFCPENSAENPRWNMIGWDLFHIDQSDLSSFFFTIFRRKPTVSRANLGVSSSPLLYAPTNPMFCPENSGENPCCNMIARDGIARTALFLTRIMLNNELVTETSLPYLQYKKFLS
jgi:hypothetical protein